MDQRDYRDIGVAAPLLPESMLDHFAIAGTPDEVETRLRELAPLVDQLIVHPVAAPDWEHDRIVAEGGPDLGRAADRSRQVKFGVGLPTCTAGMMYPVPFASPQDVVRVAIESEQLGYYEVAGNDHISTQAYVRETWPDPPDFFEPLGTVAGFARHRPAQRVARAARWGRRRCRRG